jgi:class 3 adenylate cyclase
MKLGLRCLVLVLMCMRCGMVHAQHASPDRPRPLRPISASDLTGKRVEDRVRGGVVPGLDLREFGKPSHFTGDHAAFAERSFNDTAWPPLRPDSALDVARVQWLRFHLHPAPDLRNVPLTLTLASDAAMEVFLNGARIMTTDISSGAALRSITVPILLANDSAQEVLAIRLDAGAIKRPPSFQAAMHMQDRGAASALNLMHFGLYIGVNLIIFILALVIYALDRRERSWLLLALLSLVTAAQAFCDVGSDMGLGLPASLVRTLAIGQVVLMAWPMFLLILVLLELRGRKGGPTIRAYALAALTMTLLGLGFGVIGMFDAHPGNEVLHVATGGSLMLVTAVMVVAYLLIALGLAVEVVRHAVRVMRTTGQGRWIGAGALVSMLLSFLLQLVTGIAQVPDTKGLDLVSQYCSYVAFPLAVVIYLAVRSSRNNRLVARQRDELDLEVQERTAELREAKERSDELLLNILPGEVAEELKNKGSAEAKHFDSATILFTDFKDFTLASERLSPRDLVEELNTCFMAFDRIVSARGIEKIKTIGDAYMCVGGLPDPRTSAPEDVVRAALDMQDFMKRRKAERERLGLPVFDMRVGIHTGPVVAGIVGLKKFQYDIWGDTVNTASRLESSGEIGRVNISGSTYALVKDATGLRFIPRGKVSAKGKGELEMFYVERMGTANFPPPTA